MQAATTSSIIKPPCTCPTPRQAVSSAEEGCPLASAIAGRRPPIPDGSVVPNADGHRPGVPSAQLHTFHLFSLSPFCWSMAAASSRWIGCRPLIFRMNSTTSAAGDGEPSSLSSLFFPSHHGLSSLVHLKTSKESPRSPRSIVRHGHEATCFCSKNPHKSCNLLLIL